MPQQPRQLAPFQFSLRWLFIATLVVAIFAWLVTVLPEDAWLILTIPSLPIFGLTAAILGIIYLRGRWRAFWWGYGISLVQVLLCGLFTGFYWGRSWRDWEAMLIIPVFGLVVPAASGWMGTRFFRAGQAAELPAAPRTTPPSAAPATEAGKPLGVDPS